MKKLFLLTFMIASLTLTLNAENNTSTKTNPNSETNNTAKAKKNAENSESAKAKRAKQQIEEQMKREEKYAKEQTFYQGKEYDLKSFEVNPDAIKDIPDIDIDYSDGDDVLEMD